MEQQLAQAQDEGVLADVFAEERRKAAQRDDFLRRQQDLENERQRLADEGILGDVFAEERQRATAREQQRQQPPVVEENIAPEQPIPAVEETVAPEITPEQVPNVENVIDEPGAAEVELGMEKPQTREGSYTSEERDTFTETSREKRRDRFVVSAITGTVFDRFFSTAVTPPAFKDQQAAADALNASEYNKTIPLPVSLGQKDGQSFFVSAYEGQPEVAIQPTSSPTPAPAPTVQRDVTKPEQMTPEERRDAKIQVIAVETEKGLKPTYYLAIREGDSIGIYGANYSETDGELIGSAKPINLIARPTLEEVRQAGSSAPAYIEKLAIDEGAPIHRANGIGVQAAHQAEIANARLKKAPVSAAAVDAYKITLPEGYVRQGDLYVFQPSGTVEAVKGDAAIKAAKKQAQEIEKLKREGKIKPEDESYWSTPVEGQPKDPIPDVKDTNGIQINEGDVVEFSGVLGGKGTGKVRWVGPYIANASGELQPGFWSANGVLRANGAPLTIIERDGEPISPPTIETPTKPKNMAGEVRPERAKPTPAPEFTTLHPKTQEKFNTAFEAKDAGAMNSLLDPTNKGSRAEFERRTGVKLPTTQKGTRDSVETWAAKTPVADLTDTELDRDLLRLGEYSKKTYASDALKARALELAKEFQKRQDVAATDKAAGEASARKKAIAKKALAATGGRGTVGNLAGDSLAQVRADLLSEITGTKVPKSKAGINALMKAFYQEFGIAADTEAGMQKKLAQALQDAVTETAPQPKPAAEVETPAPKKPRASQEYVDAVLPTVNAMLDGSDASTVITAAAGKKLPRKDEVRVVIEWVQQRREEGGMALPSDFAGLQMEQAYMLEPVLKALGLQTTAEVETPVAEVLARGKPRESIVFKKPVPTPLGDVIGYSWSSQLVEDVDKVGEPVLRRISNWEEAANNAETGRDIVHRFLIKKPDGTTSEVSLESTFGKMTDSDKKTVKAVVSAAKKLPFMRAELAELQDLQKQAEADYQRTQKLKPDPAKLELREPDVKWRAEKGDKVAYLDDVFLGFVESGDIDAKGELTNKAKFVYDNAWKWQGAQRKVQMTEAQKDRAKSLTRSVKKAEDLLSRENVEVAKVTTGEQPTSLAEAGPPAAGMKTPSATADQPAPISQRPSLGDTGKQIIDAWRSLQGTKVAPGETVVGWDVNGGGTYAFINDKLVKLKRDNKGFEATYTEATDADWQDVSDALDRGALQVEVRKITGLGNYQKVDAGKTVKVRHQATGKPLQEFLDTPEGAAYEARMQKAVAAQASAPKQAKPDRSQEAFNRSMEAIRSREPTSPAKPAAEVETPVAEVPAEDNGVAPAKLPKGVEKLASSPTKEGIQKAITKYFYGDKVLVPVGSGVFAVDSPSGKRSDTRVIQTPRGFYFVSGAPEIVEFGSTNTVVTKETKDKAAKSLRKKLGSQTNVGLDPSILKDAIAIGAFYLEGGARSFADFSAKMVEEFGEGVRKYLQPAYEALRKRTDIDTTGMDAEEGVETAPVAEAPTAPAAAPAARVEAETPKAAPTQAAPKPATESFPTEISLTEQPERPQASVVPPDNKPVGFSNAEMDAEAARIVGRELVRPVQEAISDDALWAQATAEFKRDSDSGRRLVTSLVATPRVVSSKEQAMLGMELVRRKNVLNAAATKFLASPEGDVGAKSEYETAQRDYDDALYANSIAGSDIGRALRFRRLTANMDMELESMLSNLKAVGNKADISKEQVAEASKIAKEYEANAKAVDALRKQAESTEADRLAEAEKVAFEAGRQAVLKDIEERAKADAAKVAEMQKRKAEHLAKKKEAEKKPSVLDDFEKSIEQRIASRRGKLYSDVLLLNAAADAADYVLLGAVKIAKGITKLGDWVASMRGSGIELNDDEMQQLFKESKAFDAGEDLPASEAPLKVKKAKAPAIDKVKAIAADEEALDSRTVYNLVVEKMKARVEANPALEKVEMSTDDLTSVISEVTADVQEFFPGITEREIRDLFSGYGKILMPSKDELAKQMRQLTALGRLNSAIEDAIADLAPLKSGVQRDRATQAIRLQQKKLARELRMMGRDYEAGEEQLRSPLDAMKARVNNQINDLDYEIRKGRKNRRPTPDADPELEKLIELRDELKRLSDFLNAPAGPTFTELVQDEKDKLDKRIGVLEKALESKQFMPKEDRKLYTQELQVKRDKRDELNEQIRKLRKIEADKSRTQEDIDRAAIASVKESIAELDRKIKEKDFARPERRTPTETAEYLALVAKKEALQDTVKEERLKLFGRKGMTDEQRIKQATAAVDKSIERMQKMLTSGNYDVPKRTSKTPETPELAQKRETRDKMRKRILELRKLKRDALIDPVAKQLKTDKKRIQTRMDKLKKRMETGDFSKPVKREKPTDPELLELLAKEEKLKERWGEMLLNHKLSQRSRAKRYWDNVFDLFSMGRFLKASTDLSAIANQGNFALFSHPVLSMRQLGGMWKAMQSDTNQKIINAKIRELPEYKSGEMKRAGLYLSLDAGPNDPLQRQEEAMASRWVDKIPKRYGGGILRATSRAYTTYLDLIRVATYLSLKNNLVEGGWFMQPQEATPERLQSVANLINNGTGRGSLGSGRFGAGMSQAAPFLNTFLFAPRFGVSRFAMALGIPLWTASKGTKVLIAKEYTKYLAGLTTAMILYSMFQDEDDKEMEFDPTSSDFGKVLFDNQRVDVMGGFQQPLVFLLRLLFGEYKNSKGLIKPLREGDRPLNLFRETPLTDKPKFTDRSGAVVVGDFLRYKLSPTASLLLNTIQGKTPVGERTDLMSEVITMPVPLIIDQMYETAKAQQDDPFMAALLMGSGVVGVRTSNQDPKEDRSKAKTAWEQLIDYTKYYSGVK